LLASAGPGDPFQALQAAAPSPAAAAAGAGSASMPIMAVVPDPPQAVQAAAAPAAAGPSSMPAIPAVPSDGDLVTAQRHLLWLYTEKMQPSLQQQLHFRSTVWQVLSADDIRRALFWRDYDVSVSGWADARDACAVGSMMAASLKACQAVVPAPRGLSFASSIVYLSCTDSFQPSGY
jgi:hypothetical protein